MLTKKKKKRILPRRENRTHGAQTTKSTAIPDGNEGLMIFSVKYSRLWMQKEQLPFCAGISLK